MFPYPDDDAGMLCQDALLGGGLDDFAALQGTELNVVEGSR